MLIEVARDGCLGNGSSGGGGEKLITHTRRFNSQ